MKSYSMPILMLLAICITTLSASADGGITTSIPASPYSANFDLQNMTGINDGTITAEDIEAFIRMKTPNSPVLIEAGIGSCFMDAGLKNNVSPAFLVATAYLEGGFGTLGWAKLHPESHNTLGYAIYFGNESPIPDNSASSWCAMVRRVAAVIANGNSYYKQNLFTISQVSTKYPGNLDSDTVANLMNELYSFSANRITGNLAQPSASTVISSNNAALYPPSNTVLFNQFGKGPTTSNPQPNSIDEWNMRGDNFFRQNMYGEAIQAYDRAIEIWNRSSNRIFIGRELRDAYQYAKKRKIAALNALGDELYRQGKFEEADKAYNQAIDVEYPQKEAAPSPDQNLIVHIEDEPNSCERLINESIALVQQNRYDEAIQSLDKVIEVNPQCTDAWFRKGMLLFTQGLDESESPAAQSKYDEAIKAFDKVIELEPDHAGAWQWKGVALGALGRITEGNAALAKVEELGYGSS